jgi:hypothetical protein
MCKLKYPKPIDQLPITKWPHQSEAPVGAAPLTMAWKPRTQGHRLQGPTAAPPTWRGRS